MLVCYPTETLKKLCEKGKEAFAYCRRGDLSKFIAILFSIFNVERGIRNCQDKSRYEKLLLYFGMPSRF
jgi:hypothetical protein